MRPEGAEAGRSVIVDSRSAGTGFGIVLKDVRGVRLLENVVARNRTGLQAEGTRDEPDAAGHVLHNRFAANGGGVAPPSDLAPGAGSMAAPWFALAGGLLAAALATLLVGRAVTFRWAR